MLRKNGRASPRESDNVQLCKLRPRPPALPDSGARGFLFPDNRWSVERSARARREPKRVGGRVVCGVSETGGTHHPPPRGRLERARTPGARTRRPVKKRRVVDNHPASAVREHPRARPTVPHVPIPPCSRESTRRRSARRVINSSRSSLSVVVGWVSKIRTSLIDGSGSPCSNSGRL